VTPVEALPNAPLPAVRPDARVERLRLDGRSWVDIGRGWLDGADTLYDELVESVAWHQNRLWRYERWVDEPRLAAWGTPASPPHPALVEIHRAVRRRYRVPFDGFALAWYRDGRDGQAFHRDDDLRWTEDTLVVLLTLGARRSWLMRPRSVRRDHEDPNQGATHDLVPSGGDLMVMGGRCQADWLHSVPKVAAPVRGRVSVQWRWTSRRGRPERGPGYAAPRNFTRGR
jgi:alkylated DNA repair dioxygenase AlkB